MRCVTDGDTEPSALDGVRDETRRGEEGGLDVSVRLNE